MKPCKTKLLEGQSPWAVTVQAEDGNIISLIGEVPHPVQVVDRTTAECLVEAQLRRNSKTDFADRYNTRMRVTTLDGASSNFKSEREGGKLHRPSVVYSEGCFCV